MTFAITCQLLWELTRGLAFWPRNTIWNIALPVRKGTFIITLRYYKTSTSSPIVKSSPRRPAPKAWLATSQATFARLSLCQALLAVSSTFPSEVETTVCRPYPKSRKSPCLDCDITCANMSTIPLPSPLDTEWGNKEDSLKAVWT